MPMTCGDAQLWKELLMNAKHFRIEPGSNVDLAKHPPGFTSKYSDKGEVQQKLLSDLEKLREFQEVLYAEDSYALLIVIQALDAAGKDSVIKHVMSGINPQGCSVASFKEPSAEELDHDYLWRCHKSLPRRGMIGIFNRSYYEEVLTVRIHPEFLDRQKLPAPFRGKDIWKNRMEDINCFERYCVRNGIVLLKFFLNVSKEEQKKRFLERLGRPEKNWKFSERDVSERKCWDEYHDVYREVLSKTSTSWAPWYVIPADHKWFTRVAVAEIVVDTLQSLHLSYPDIGDDQRRRFGKIKGMLEKEGS